MLDADKAISKNESSQRRQKAINKSSRALLNEINGSNSHQR